MKQWSLFLLFGFLIIAAGTLASNLIQGIALEYFDGIGQNSLLLFQAIVMSSIIIPVIFFLYRKLYQKFSKPELPAYALTRLPHFLTGFFFVSIIASLGFYLLIQFEWITIEEWHSASTWFLPLLLNVFTILFYEALPIEFVYRGFLFDVLQLKMKVWLTVPLQAFLFAIFNIVITLLEMSLSGMTTMESLAFLPSQTAFMFFFGLLLGLTRVLTGSLWASVGFHLGYYLFIRFLFFPSGYEDFSLYGEAPIVTYQDTFSYGFAQNASFVFIITVSIAISLVLLLIKWISQNEKTKSEQ